jgi:hypothetical protein
MNLYNLCKNCQNKPSTQRRITLQEKLDRNMSKISKPAFSDYYNEFLKGLKENNPEFYNFLKLFRFPARM